MEGSTGDDLLPGSVSERICSWASHAMCMENNLGITVGSVVFYVCPAMQKHCLSVWAEDHYAVQFDFQAGMDTLAQYLSCVSLGRHILLVLCRYYWAQHPLLMYCLLMAALTAETPGSAEHRFAALPCERYECEQTWDYCVHENMYELVRGVLALRALWSRWCSHLYLYIWVLLCKMFELPWDGKLDNQVIEGRWPESFIMYFKIWDSACTSPTVLIHKSRRPQDISQQWCKNIHIYAMVCACWPVLISSQHDMYHHPIMQACRELTRFFPAWLWSQLRNMTRKHKLNLSQCVSSLFSWHTLLS